MDIVQIVVIMRALNSKIFGYLRNFLQGFLFNLSEEKPISTDTVLAGIIDIFGSENKDLGLIPPAFQDAIGQKSF